MSILGPKKGVSSVAAARLQRWSLLLSAYNYDIEFRPTEAHGNADALSRLPLDRVPKQLSEAQVFNIHQIEVLPVTSKTIRTATQRDPVLSRVLMYTRKGWPNPVPKLLQPYFSRLSELSVEEGCLLWGMRVVIPQSLKKTILAELHKEHLGVSRMKALARSHVWWRGLDKDLEALAKSCQACLAIKQAPAVAPLHPWVWPNRPWQRFHIDFAGPFLDKSFFIAIDAHSKWAEVIEMSQTSTSRTIAVLRHLFASHGIPEQVVSDNGPQFTSEDLAEFMKANGIWHTRCAPYHPASNGEAERFVRTFKEAMKTGRGDGLTVAHRLENFLLTYRTTPHTTTGTPPCELLMGRGLRTRWDMLKPDVSQNVHRSQERQKEHHDQHARQRTFHVGQTVMAKNMRAGPSWVPGTIVQQLGPVTYLVDVSDGRVWKRHVDHLKDRGAESLTPWTPDQTENIPGDPQLMPTEQVVDLPTIATPPVIITPSESGTTPLTSDDTLPDLPSLATSNASTTRRYPARERRPPDRYSATWTLVREECSNWTQ